MTMTGLPTVERYEPCPNCKDRGCPKCDPGIVEILRRTSRLPDIIPPWYPWRRYA